MAGNLVVGHDDMLARYEALTQHGHIEDDAAQRAVVLRLAKLRSDLINLRCATKSSALGWLFAKRQDKEPIKGLYIHGGVGRGKTMLMDLFFDCAPDLPKRRLHFQDFMADTHERIHQWRAREKERGEKAVDPIAEVADAIAGEARLLCFDEFQVNDIADAMLLGRLFAKLFARNVVVVATSNTAPRDLYKDGLNRALFLPFIDLLCDRLNVLHLEARTDYRLEKLSGSAVYFQPLDAAAAREIDALWQRLAGGTDRADTLTVKGRRLHVPRASMGAARFSFADLCEQPLGGSDYLALARRYHTLLVEQIPVLAPDKRNEARRFIHLIDALYDNRVKLIASAAAEPAALYPQGDGSDAFMRTASRLIEMRSAAYLSKPHGHSLSAKRQDAQQRDAEHNTVDDEGGETHGL